ncbi:MAG TPA: DUF6526 family protein [Gemmatimonadales bacterium]|jgi:hypothetical protein
MSHPPAQHLGNHARYVPLYHYVALPILLINLGDSVRVAYLSLVWENILQVLVAVALLIMLFAMRTFATTVQDRVIRLEERLRFERIFPDDLRQRIPEFTRDQFVALRFASDHEVAALAREVLDQRITDRSAIKQMVQAWRADTFRA